ncbi:hypothetical protein [Gordonia sp. (in: high G+C Gram-positive bacteria)]|uniref:hypothetical protein n=1 Tax=Gordonia sp. (in: high G+C Gram-positive bacteria) TaxID=84139 RepID=UPI0026041E63|nr:hypothetical protein [Gordonia sp. (in: high G+C Gram-positive bacteria)]
MRRVRTAAGAARYKQPIGSIIIMRGGGKHDLNLSHMDDDHLTELMEDAAAAHKNPQVYEVAFTEWARRQSDVEPGPDLPPILDPWVEPDPTHSDRLDMLSMERDAARGRLEAQVHVDDASWQDDADRYEVYSALIEHEQRLAATNIGTAPEWAQEVEGAVKSDGTADVEISAAQRRQWAILEQAEELADTEGISYEEALAKVQGLDVEQVRRREFVRLGRQKGYSATSFNALIDEVHLDYQYAMEERMEEATRGQMIARNAQTPEFWERWNQQNKTLFSMTDAEARKLMSPEAKEFLDQIGGRVTKADLVSLIELGKLGENLEPETIQTVFSQWEGRHKRGDYLQ